jgi:putative membrane protein
MEMKPVLYEWHMDISVVILTVAILCFYYLVSGFKRHRNGWCFWAAFVLFLLMECSPLHYWGMAGNFSTHMISHVILLLLCGPLLVLGIPSKSAFRTLKLILRLSSFFKRYNWIAWITGVGVMWLWHIPAVFDSAIGQNMLLHSGSLLLAGMIFSWPLFGPVKNDHIHPIYGIVYLFTACISCSLLGLLITFAPLNTYGHYSQQDQQAAGLIMWVPCCFVYLSGCLYLLMRWFAERTDNAADNFSKLNHSLNTHERR